MFMFCYHVAYMENSHPLLSDLNTLMRKKIISIILVSDDLDSEKLIFGSYYIQKEKNIKFSVC